MGRGMRHGEAADYRLMVPGWGCRRTCSYSDELPVAGAQGRPAECELTTIGLCSVADHLGHECAGDEDNEEQNDEGCVIELRDRDFHSTSHAVVIRRRPAEQLQRPPITNWAFSYWLRTSLESESPLKRSGRSGLNRMLCP